MADYYASGELTTGTKTGDGRPVEVSVSATLPAGTSVDLTVYQDESGASTADAQQTVSVSNGTNVYSLSGFATAAGASYWLGFSLSANTAQDATPSVGMATLSLLTSPESLSATAASPSQIDVSWNGSGNEDSFDVYRAEASGSALGDYSHVDSVAAPTTSYNDTGRENGERYYYRVTATVAGVESAISNEDDAATPVAAVTIDSLDTSVENEVTVNWAKNDNSPDGNFEIYRSADGTLGTLQHTTADATVASWTDTSVVDGEQYHYTVRRLTDHASADSQQSTVSLLPGAGSVSTTVQNGNDVQVTWVDLSDNEDGFRVYYRRTGGTGWTNDSGDLAGGTTSHTISGLLDGEQYDVRVEVFTEDATEQTDLVPAATTDLPDAQQPTLGNGVEDEIAVDIPDTTNYGDYRIQTRETGESVWGATAVGFDDRTVASDSDTSGTVSGTVTGREDGEEYEVRIRSETEHVNGAWTTPLSIVTKFPGATSLTATTASDTQIDLAWNDNSDNETGFKVLRERQLTGGTYMSPALEIADVAANTTSHNDGTVQPNRTYRYTVRAYTEHTTADSNTDTATTTGDDVPTEPAPATGWYAEIDLPNGETIRPRILSAAQFVPVLNDLPRCRLPVEKARRWEGAEIDEQPLRVWKDGYQLPIDEVRTVTREEDHYVIHGLGGTELDEYTDGIEVIEADTHTRVGTFINNETSYTPNVDDPSTDTRDNVLFQDADTQAEFEDLIPAHPFAADTPLEVTGSGKVRQIESAQFIEAESGGSSGGTEVTDLQGRWSGDASIRLSGGQSRSWVWQVQSEIPAARAQVVFVLALPTDPTPGLTVTFDGNEAETFTEGTLNGTTDQFDLKTYSVTLNSGLGDTANAPLSPGNYQLDLSVSGSEDVYLDFLHFRDTRWSYGQDITPSSGVVTGWEQMPEAQDVEFEAVNSVEQVTGALFTIVIDDTTGNQALHVRKDTNDSYTTQANTSSLDHNFASSGQLLQGKTTLGRYGSGTNSGEFGDQSQELDSFELRADLEDTPVLLDKSYSGEKKRILNRMAESGDFVWEIRRDGGTYSVEWTQAGQRTSDREPGFVTFSGRHTVEESYQKIIVFGASESIDDERFTVTSSTGFGALLGLDESWIVPASETVYDPNTGTEFTRRTDYNMDWQVGAIELINGGSMSLDTEYAIDYNRKTRGEYALPGVTSPRTKEVQIAAASTDLECSQLAIGLVKQLQDPLEEVTATITSANPKWALVDALTTDQLPFDGPLEVREIDNQPSQVSVRLGTRQSINEAVQEIRDRLDAVSSRV